MDFKYELNKALFYNEYERVKKLIESEDFSSDLLTDTGDFAEIGAPTPVYFITQLWNIILPGNWGIAQDAVDKTISKLKLINEYFFNRFNIHTDQPINLDKYITFYQRYDYSISDDDILYKPVEVLISERYREIDIDLYCAICRADVEKVERLLKMGANDEVCFEDSTDSAYGFVNDDIIERDIWQTKTLFPNPDYNARKFSNLDVKAMIGSAWKYKMVELLNQYYKKKKEECAT